MARGMAERRRLCKIAGEMWAPRVILEPLHVEARLESHRQGKRHPDLSGKDLESMAQPLESLEEVFRPLVKDLPPDLEPVLEMFVEADFE